MPWATHRALVTPIPLLHPRPTVGLLCLRHSMPNTSSQPPQQGKAESELRRPPCSTLYDVFKNICDDEMEHVKTMTACEAWIVGGPSPVPLAPAPPLSHYPPSASA